MSNLIDARTPPPPIPGAADRLSPDAAPSEAQLVRRVAQGDREAFGELYDRCSTPLYSLAVCMLNDPRAAEEVLQEVFLSIWENAPLFDEVAGSHFSWAVTMTRNKSMDRIRDWQRKFYEFEVLANCALVAGTTDATNPGGGVLDDRVAQLRATLNECSRQRPSCSERIDTARQDPAATGRVGKILDPTFDLNASIRRNVNELMTQRMRKQATQGSVLSPLLEIMDFVVGLPSRLNRIMDAITNQELEVKVKSVDAKMVVEGIQKVANRITAGLILAALIMGASQLMQVQTSFHLFGYPGLATLCFLAAAAGGFWLVISIFVQDHKARKKPTRS